MSGLVVAVHRSRVHGFSKEPTPIVRLLAGLGVEGDAHSGVTVQHRSRVAKDPAQPNLRQVHLIHAELLDELADAGFEVAPGSLGENLTTRGVDLLALGTGTRLRVNGAIIEVTGLRNPCVQIDRFRPGLLKHLIENIDGVVVRRAGVMGIVRVGGQIEPGAAIQVEAPSGEHRPLEPV